jgi:hypothetical protein
MYFLYVIIRTVGEALIYIYMSILLFEIQMLCTCVFFVDNDDDVYLIYML